MAEGMTSGWARFWDSQGSAEEFNAAQSQIDRDFQAEQAGISREFNAQEAAKARDFSERMSNTAYQRAKTDMQKAGLNPYLMYNQGGASTPTASAAHSSAPSGYAASSGGGGSKGTDFVLGLVQSAMQLAKFLI